MFNLATRNDAYLLILHGGLLAIRESAYSGKTKLCEIEAEHLHNIPSLIDEPHRLRHEYYIIKEREHYIEQLEKLAEVQYLEHLMLWYRDAWTLLVTANDNARKP